MAVSESLGRKIRQNGERSVRLSKNERLLTAEALALYELGACALTLFVPQDDTRWSKGLQRNDYRATGNRNR